MTSRSPIASRLALLYEQWETFATDSDARVLRWLIRDDERRMLEALLALEDDEHGQLAVLFFVLDTPFERGRYGHDLRHDLEQQLAAMGEDFAAMARSPSGVTSEATVSDIGLLMQTCAELVRHIDDAVEMIALVLWPKAVAEPKSFAEWLHRAARVVPPRVRLVVVDRVEAPVLDSLDGPHVPSVTSNLDMQGALEELAADAPGRASAGGRFREAFVAMIVSADTPASSASPSCVKPSPRRSSRIRAPNSSRVSMAPILGARSPRAAGGVTEISCRPSNTRQQPRLFQPFRTVAAAGRQGKALVTDYGAILDRRPVRHRDGSRCWWHVVGQPRDRGRGSGTGR